MLMPRPTTSDGSIFYPESEGQLRPEPANTRQFRCIAALVGNLTALFRERPDVSVCGNLLWYPIKSEAAIREAPDVSVVFGRPKGERSSYKQWEEGNVPLTAVFDVLPRWTPAGSWLAAMEFYEDHGVEEYYTYVPDANHLCGYERREDSLFRVRRMDGFVSPRLGVQFDLSGPQLVVRYPNGQPFLTIEEIESEQGRAIRLEQLTRRVLLRVATSEEAQELQHLLEAPPVS